MPRKAKAMDSLPEKVKGLLPLLGERIQVARKSRRYSQQKLADLACISRETLRRLETGNSKVSLGTLLAVLWALQLEDDLLSVADPNSDTMGAELESFLPKRVHQKGKRGEDAYDF